MARHLVALAALGLILTGCVGQDKYNALKMEKDQLAEQLGAAQTSEAAAKSEAAAWKAQHDALIKNGGDLQKVNADLMKEVAELRAMNASLDEKYQHALEKQGTTVVQLNPELNKALTDFAAANPELVEYDPSTGIVKFKSDVTFAKGSAELTPNAKQAIAKFATILNSPAAAKYEMLVAGHTDSTPVSNPATVKAGHLDNWYLSSHRAIAVGKELIGHQISPKRVGAVGYGDQRPVASNGTSEGQAKNRRVEVVILPTTYKGGTSVAGTDALNGKTAPAPKKNTNLNKDASIGPMLNK